MSEHAHTEWTSLQFQFDAYEKYSLVIKIVSVASLALYSANLINPNIVLLINILLWGQDAIWKTFQFRIYERLLQLEQAITENTQIELGFNTSWERTRPGFLGLLKEYCLNALRPTVMYPHILIVAISIWQLLTT